MADHPVGREFLGERDRRIYEMRSSGVSHADIAKRFDISIQAVSAALSRQLGRLNRDAVLSYPEVMRMELERLDALQKALWPQTQYRKVMIGDEETTLAPDVKVVAQVLAIMDRRAKLLGLEVERIDMRVDSGEPVRAALAEAGETKQEFQKVDRQSETMQMLELMGKAGVLDPASVDSMMKQITGGDPDEDEDDEIIEAEVIEDDEEG